MELQKVLQQLTSTNGESLTTTIVHLLPEECEKTITPLGNLLVRFPGEVKSTILLDAHMDTIHFIVTGILPNGFLKVSPCGGVDTRVLSGSNVIVWGKQPLKGLFSIMPPHLKKSGESSTVSMDELVIDTGYSFEETSQQVSIGDKVTFQPSAVSLANNKLSCAGLDNLAGVSSFVLLAHQLVKIKLKKTVVLQFSNFEETGHRYAGAITGTFSVLPEQALVIDASFAKMPGLNYATPGNIGLGVMIGCSPMLSREVSSYLQELANANEIPYSLEVMGGSSGTNADGITSCANGIPTGLVSFPLLNMHTPVEVISEDDLNNLITLLELYCRNGGVPNGK